MLSLTGEIFARRCKFMNCCLQFVENLPVSFVFFLLFCFCCLLTYNISTSDLSVTQDRKYVTMKSRVLHPEFRGRMVCSGLITEYLYYVILSTI